MGEASNVEVPLGFGVPLVLGVEKLLDMGVEEALDLNVAEVLPVVPLDLGGEEVLLDLEVP